MSMMTVKMKGPSLKTHLPQNLPYLKYVSRFKGHQVSQELHEEGERLLGCCRTSSAVAEHFLHRHSEKLKYILCLNFVQTWPQTVLAAAKLMVGQIFNSFFSLKE